MKLESAFIRTMFVECNLHHDTLNCCCACLILCKATNLMGTLLRMNCVNKERLKSRKYRRANTGVMPQAREYSVNALDLFVCCCSYSSKF